MVYRPRLINMRSLIRELRRRRVLQTAAMYVAAAWAGTEMLGFLLQALNFPRWTVTIVAIVFVLGFPVAMLLAWAFDVGEDGIRRTAPGSTKGKVTISAAAAFLVASTAALFYLIYPDGPKVAPQFAVTEFDPPENSIAVLPFVNMSEDPDNVYFSDGIAEELLHKLSQNPNLWVTARTSSFKYRDQEVDARTIGEQLNVASILEGSVRKAGTSVRITVQLINTKDGYHDWSETYDRELTNIFAVQEEIANSVGDELTPRLAVAGRAAPRRPARFDLGNGIVYDDYLRARYLMQYGTKARLHASIDAFQVLVAEYPAFAQGWQGLAQAYSRLPGQAEATDRLIIEAATNAIDADASLGPAHALIAGVHERRWNWRAAEKSYEVAISLSPSDAAIRGSFGVFLSKTGSIEHSIDQLSFAVQRDPESSEYRHALARARAASGQTPSVIRHTEQKSQSGEDSTATSEDAAQLSHGQAALYFARLGDVDRAYRRAWLAIDRGDLPLHALWIPELAKFRSDPRFEELSQRLGLLELWHASGPPDTCSIDERSLRCR